VSNTQVDGEDHDLVAAARAGSAEAAAQLFERHWPAAWKLAFTVTGRRALAEDVAQDSFERAYSSLAAFNGRSSFATWLHRIIVNRALNAIRDERRLQPLGGEPWSEGRPLEEADGTLVDAVRRLPAERRMAVVLRYWLDYSPAEIADMLGWRLGTVHSRLGRGLKELRSYLEVERGD